MMSNSSAAKAILPRLRINTGLVERVLVGFIRDAVMKAGQGRCVVGLSGGVDSALAACLAAKALGSENVLALCMPAPESSPKSLRHAEEYIEQLRLPKRVIPIGDMAAPYRDRFPKLGRMRLGNIYARLRMLVLYDQSVVWGGLVLGTSNKTEALLGYSTIFGDNAAALQALMDLYKCQVRQLAAALHIPDAILDKAPSADLWLGQTDEEELGFTYDVADALLYLLVDERYSLEDVEDYGFEREFVAELWQRVKAQHYKRTMPNIAKLSHRSLGHDFHYLRDDRGRVGRPLQLQGEANGPYPLSE